VLGSSNDKFFSIGFDIPELFDLARKDFRVFYQAFNGVCMDLYTLPKPTIAAITGHAIAGGCILALCCDYRFIAEGRKLMGLNEIKLGIPVPYPGDCILRQVAGTRNAREIMSTGEFYHSEELLQIGMVDQVLPLDQVLPKAIEKAGLLGALPHEAFGMIKRNRVETVEAQVLAHLAEKEQFFIECWYSDEARVRLKEAIKKF
jgi:enoyl-CoA hydratase/carnithine racemase